jgi:hypothetical protein
LCQVLVILRPEPLADFRSNGAMIKGFIPRIAFTFHDIRPRIWPARKGSARMAPPTWGDGAASRRFVRTYDRVAADHYSIGRYLPRALAAGSGGLGVAEVRPATARPSTSLCYPVERRCEGMFRQFSAPKPSARRSHVASLSGDRANLAIALHSAANFRNLSEGSIGPSSPLCRIPDRTNLKRPQWFPDHTNLDT